MKGKVLQRIGVQKRRAAFIVENVKTCSAGQSLFYHLLLCSRKNATVEKTELEKFPTTNFLFLKSHKFSFN